MLIPRKVKHRKQHRPHRTGAASGGTDAGRAAAAEQATMPEPMDAISKDTAVAAATPTETSQQEG